MLESITSYLPYLFFGGMLIFWIAGSAADLWKKKVRRATDQLWFGVALASFFLIVAVLIVLSIPNNEASSIPFLPLCVLTGIISIPILHLSIRSFARRVHGHEISLPREDKRSLRITLVLSLTLLYVVIVFDVGRFFYYGVFLLIFAICYWMYTVGLLLWVEKWQRQTGQVLLEIPHPSSTP